MKLSTIFSTGLFLFGALSVNAQNAKADYTVCRTFSVGVPFSDSDMDPKSARSRVISDCKADSRTSNSECVSNVSCQDQGGAGFGGAYISTNQPVCHAGGQSLCKAYLWWSTGSSEGESAVVTVTSRNEGIEKVYACNDNGTGYAPWISPDDQYIFKLYASNICGAEVTQWNAPIAEVFIQGAP